jgi:hypothetical protein
MTPASSQPERRSQECAVEQGDSGPKRESDGALFGLDPGVDSDEVVAGPGFGGEGVEDVRTERDAVLDRVLEDVADGVAGLDRGREDAGVVAVGEDRAAARQSAFRRLARLVLRLRMPRDKASRSAASQIRCMWLLSTEKWMTRKVRPPDARGPAGPRG